MFANIRAAGALEQHLSLTEIGRALWAALPGRGGSAPELSGETAGQRWRMTARPYLDTYVDKASPSPFEPKLVTLRVQSPSGAVLQIDTVRLQRRTDR
jgi:general secretion pathway protein I